LVTQITRTPDLVHHEALIALFAPVSTPLVVGSLMQTIFGFALCSSFYVGNLLRLSIAESIQEHWRRVRYHNDGIM